MVVASEGRKKHGGSHVSANSISMAQSTTGVEPVGADPAAKAVLVCQPNSHPFEERTIYLKQAVKIGRSVVKVAPTPNNAIFECRVLSRNHATLWYDSGHFYLMDNCSSNGTFINTKSCGQSKYPSEGVRHEVFSGDVLQFGVDVVDNQGKEESKYPCIVATLKLYHPDGSEARRSLTMSTVMPLKDLYELNKYVQEAIKREASLEAKLCVLRRGVEEARGAASSSWRAALAEQRLLLRVRALEARANNAAPAADVLLDDKRNYQEAAQEALREAHEERLSLQEQVCVARQELSAANTECAALRTLADHAYAELEKLAERCEQQMSEASAAMAAAEEREAAALQAVQDLHTHPQQPTDGVTVEVDGGRPDNSRSSEEMEDAIRDLPDYLKYLLPNALLDKVGITPKFGTKSEIEEKIYDLRRKLDELDQIGSQSNHVPCEKSKGELEAEAPKENLGDSSTDDEKCTRHPATISALAPYINGNEEQSEAVSSWSSVSDTSLVLTDVQTELSDDNANSTLARLLTQLTNHNHIQDGVDLGMGCKDIESDDSRRRRELQEELVCCLHQLGVAHAQRKQEELAQVQCKVSDLQKTVDHLKGSLVTADYNNATLRQANRELLITKLQTQLQLDKLLSKPGDHDETSQLSEQTNTDTAQTLKRRDDTEKTDDAAEDMHKERAERLQQQLTEAQEEAQIKDTKISQLTSRVDTLLTEIEERPAICDIEKLTFTVCALQSQLDTKESILNDLKTELESIRRDNQCLKVEKMLQTSKMNGHIEEVLDASSDSIENVTISNSKLDASYEFPSPSQSFRLDDEERIQVMLQSGSHDSSISRDTREFHDLEEELVKTKEKWAALLEDKAHLSRELQQMRGVVGAGVGGAWRGRPSLKADLCLYLIPVFGAIVYLFLYQYIS